MNYEVRFCNCGRIHVMPKDELDWLSEDWQNRSIIRICANCGATDIMFLSEYMEGYAVNCNSFNDGLNKLFSKETKVYYTRGIKVHMMSGTEADSEQSGYFVNCQEWKKIMGNGYESLPEAEKAGKKWATVDTKRLIRDIEWEFKEKADDILNSISGYAVKIHWEGTKYCTDYNK